MVDLQPRVKPGLSVQQVLTTDGTTIQSLPARLKAVIIGKKVNIVDQVQSAAKYMTGSPNTVIFPDYESASRIYKDSVSVLFKNIVFNIASVIKANVYPVSGTRSGTVGINTGKYIEITDGTANFSTNAKENDTVILSHGSFGTIEAKLVTIVSATKFLIDKDLGVALNGATVTYVLKRAPGEVDLSYTDRLKDSVTSDPFINVLPNDDVKINHPNQGIINTFVSEVIDNDEIKLGVDLLPATNIVYTITRKNASAVSVISSKSGSFLPDVGATTTYFLSNNDSNTTFAGVAKADTVRIQSGNAITEAKVDGVIDNNTLQLDRQYPAGLVIYSVLRTQEVNAPFNVTSGSITLPDSDSDGFVDGQSFTLAGTITVGSLTVASADIFVSYEALSTKNAMAPITVPNDTQVEPLLGIANERNPLALGVQLAMANTIFSVDAMAIEADTNTGWLNALGRLERKRVHALALLTQSATYQSYARSHVDGMSTPFKNAWRVVFSNLPHPYETVTTTEKAGGILTFVGSTPDYLTLYDVQQSFTEVRIDGFVKFTYKDGSNGNKTVYLKVIDKVNASKIVVDAFEYEPPSGVSPGKGSYIKGAAITTSGLGATPTTFPITGSYTTFYKNDRNEEAQALGNIAYSFANRRVVLISNETCIIDINGSPKELPGYYIAAAYAGLSSGTAPHQGLTNYPLAGILGVRKTDADGYFDADQLGVLASGGCWVVCQEVLDQSAPYAWQQLTTAAAISLKAGEYSFTKNFDEISYAIYDGHQQFPGRNNLVKRALTAANLTTNAILNARTNNDQDSPIGGALGDQITSFTFNGHVPDPLIKDTSLAEVDMELPLPWNHLGFVLRA